MQNYNMDFILCPEFQNKFKQVLLSALKRSQ